MSVLRVETPIDTPKELRTAGSVPVAFVLFAVCFVIWLLTRAHFMADTNVYASAVLQHPHGQRSSDFRLLNGNPFWDFGHLLWRPLGWVTFVAAKPLTALAGYQSERDEVIVTLLGINLLATGAGIFFFFRLCSRIVSQKWAVIVATLTLLSTDAFLNYAHSGTAYVPGLTCLIAGMYFSSSPSEGGTFFGSMLTGLMYASAVLFWFPYLFVLPAAFVTPLVIQEYDRGRVRNVVRSVALCAAAGIASYTVVIIFLGIRDFGSLKNWIVAAGHGQIQAGGVRLLARLAFSVPRSFVNMGRDGMWLKRYLLHDPYTPVSLGMLIRLSLWKLGLFYVGSGWLVVQLTRTKAGIRLLLWLALACVPLIVFALFIFEAGSIERYLPLYPFAFASLAYVLASTNTGRSSKIAL